MLTTLRAYVVDRWCALVNAVKALLADERVQVTEDAEGQV